MKNFNLKSQKCYTNKSYLKLCIKWKMSWPYFAAVEQLRPTYYIYLNIFMTLGRWVWDLYNLCIYVNASSFWLYEDPWLGIRPTDKDPVLVILASCLQKMTLANGASWKTQFTSVSLPTLTLIGLQSSSTSNNCSAKIF